MTSNHAGGGKLLEEEGACEDPRQGTGESAWGTDAHHHIPKEELVVGRGYKESREWGLSPKRSLNGTDLSCLRREV